MKSIILCFIFMAVCIAVCLAVCRHWMQKVRRSWEKDLSDAIAEERKLRRAASKEVMDFVRGAFADYDNRLSDLEGGVVPDYEQAKEAAQAVNDFNKGLSAIMGYDPFEARRKTQEERGSKK